MVINGTVKKYKKEHSLAPYDFPYKIILNYKNKKTSCFLLGRQHWRWY